VRDSIHCAPNTVDELIKWRVAVRAWIVILVVAAGCGTGTGDTAKGVPFSSPDGKFSIDFPGVPQEEATPPNPLFRKVEGTEYLVDQGERAYFVRYARCANKIEKIEISLNAGRDGMLSASPGARLLSDTGMQIQGHSAREFVMALPEGYTQRVQVIITEFEVFQVIAIGAPGEENSSATNAYFASFKLLPWMPPPTANSRLTPCAIACRASGPQPAPTMVGQIPALVSQSLRNLHWRPGDE
jgi:hypothetical protein